MDASTATHEGKQKLLRQAKHDAEKAAKAQAIAKADAAKAASAKTDAAKAKTQPKDESFEKETDSLATSGHDKSPTGRIGIRARVLHCHMAEDGLPHGITSA